MTEPPKRSSIDSSSKFSSARRTVSRWRLVASASRRFASRSTSPRKSFNSALNSARSCSSNEERSTPRISSSDGGGPTPPPLPPHVDAPSVYRVHYAFESFTFLRAQFEGLNGAFLRKPPKRPL